jgi:hypothetical protein
MPGPSASGDGAPGAEPAWWSLPDEALLDFRLSDLPLTIAGSELATRIEELYAELRSRGISFRPHFWLSDEWFTPDGVAGSAIPFYLAHPRLARLELNQMLEVEGGTREWCLRILRHETGHAIDNAYRLRRKRDRQRLFGRSSLPYPDTYAPKPYSKKYVIHLDLWYAQSHPDEDFAETFAVWLDPESRWRERYAGWPALKKLEYVDSLMRSVGARPPPSANVAEVDELSTLKRTLREHYRAKREKYGMDYPNFYDEDLRRVFTDARDGQARPTAASFLKRVRKEVRRQVAQSTGQYQYTIDRVLEDMIARCRELRLRLRAPEDQTKTEFAVVLTVQVMNYLHSGRHRVAL